MKSMVGKGPIKKKEPAVFKIKKPRYTLDASGIERGIFQILDGEDVIHKPTVRACVQLHIFGAEQMKLHKTIMLGWAKFIVDAMNEKVEVGKNKFYSGSPQGDEWS